MNRLLALCALALGCGGTTVRTDAGRDASATDAAGCPSRVVAGEACPDDALVCLSDDACNDCYCQSRRWVCTTRVCVRNPPTCPTARPSTGDRCSVPRDVCDYGAGCSTAHCVCGGSAWTCDVTVCRDE